MEAFRAAICSRPCRCGDGRQVGYEEIDRQLEDFQSTWTGSRQLREVFQNPSIQLETKLKVLDAMVPRIGMLKQVRNFVALLLQNDRIHAVESITSDYRNEINRRLHISEAEITSVRELNPEEKSKIEAKASALPDSRYAPSTSRMHRCWGA